MSTFALICLILSLISFITYITTVYIKYTPDCISESYYLIKNRWLFTFWVLSTIFLILPAWLETSLILAQFLPFLSCCALSLVGICPRYLELDRKIHITAAAVAWIISIVWNIVMGIYIVPLILGILLIIVYYISQDNILFWIESAAFINIYLSILWF